MATLNLNNSLTISPTVGGQPSISQAFTTVQTVNSYAESVITPSVTETLVSALVGFAPATALRIRNITSASAAGTTWAVTVRASVGGTVIATLDRGQELCIVGTTSATMTVQYTAAGNNPQLYLLAST